MIHLYNFWNQLRDNVEKIIERSKTELKLIASVNFWTLKMPKDEAHRESVLNQIE
jgi:hypothetical protein